MTAEPAGAAPAPVTLAEDAPAKLNLALHLRRRRGDGYHDLETLFAFTRFGDRLEAAPADGLTLDLAGDWAGPLAAEPDNLVLRSARALKVAAGVASGAALRLDKRIPVAAGLGGGSADAAAALRLLNRLWKLDWPLERLEPLARRLGADVAACLRLGVTRGEGVGDVLTPVTGASFAGRPVLLVNPRVAVPTAAVFAAWDGVDRGPLPAGTDAAMLASARNDLTAPALGIQPVIGRVLDVMAAQPGAALVRMSGSGATCFALFADGAACASAAATLCAAHSGWWVEATAILS